MRPGDTLKKTNYTFQIMLRFVAAVSMLMGKWLLANNLMNTSGDLKLLDLHFN